MLICLTGTIQPPSQIKELHIVDSNQRLQQYLANILYLIIKSRKVNKIVFCENSHYHDQIFDHLKDIAKMFGKTFEYLTFQGNSEKVVSKGRGYGEQEILEYFLLNSELVESETSFIKLTGRYQVVNIDQVLNSISNQDTTFVRMIPWEKRCSTAFFKVSKNIFNNYLKGCGEKVNDSKGEEYQLEGIYYKQLSSLQLSKCNILPVFDAKTGSGYRLRPHFLKDSIKQFLNILGFYTL